jgi:hypothetical protein
MINLGTDQIVVVIIVIIFLGWSFIDGPFTHFCDICDKKSNMIKSKLYKGGRKNSTYYYVCKNCRIKYKIDSFARAAQLHGITHPEE